MMLETGKAAYKFIAILQEGELDLGRMRWAGGGWRRKSPELV